jgi:putative polyhydroxyalkanoate system protein
MPRWTCPDAVQPETATVPEIHIHRTHELGLERARKVARRWAAQAEKDYDVTCHIIEGPAVDKVEFKRSGVNGVMTVAGDHFAVDCKLGILFGAFKGKIEEEATQQLEKALAKEAAKLLAK